MINRNRWFTVLIISLTVTILLAGLAYAQVSTDSQPDGATAPVQQMLPVLGEDSSLDVPPQVVIPDKYRPARTRAPGAAANANSEVYFTPQDENTSTTVLFLYNTSSITATVGIETFRLSGSTYISTSVSIPANNLVRICGDSVATIGTWTDPILINFTTSSTYARMTLPAGVKAEGYVAWNGGATYDPLQAVPTLPLRFSTDPLTIFLPTAQKQ